MCHVAVLPPAVASHPEAAAVAVTRPSGPLMGGGCRYAPARVHGMAAVAMRRTVLVGGGRKGADPERCRCVLPAGRSAGHGAVVGLGLGCAALGRVQGPICHLCYLPWNPTGMAAHGGGHLVAASRRRRAAAPPTRRGRGAVRGAAPRLAQPAGSGMRSLARCRQRHVNKELSSSAAPLISSPQAAWKMLLQGAARPPPPWAAPPTPGCPRSPPSEPSVSE